MGRFGSVLTAMVTPFAADGSLDLGRARALAARLVGSGSDGLVVAGSTGESPTLTPEERTRLVEAVADEVGDRAPVVAGTGTNDTAASIALSKDARRAGARGIMAVVPYYNKPPQAAMYRHFAAIAEAVDLPLMVYNVPGRTGANLLPATLARLAGLENVVAVKEASGNLDQVSEVVRAVPAGFTVYSGDDSLTLPILSVGGHGVVSVASHLVGDRIRAMIQAYQGGQVERARSIHLELFPLFKAMFVTTNPIPVKVALRLVGMDVGGFRLPLAEPGDDEVRVIMAALEGAGLLPVEAAAG